MSELEAIRQRPVMEELGQLPNTEEVIVALKLVRNGKAPGNYNILPEMVKVGTNNMDFIMMLKELMDCSWDERKVPKKRVDAFLIPIPKKDNLTSCDNWRGVGLLEVVGKMVARVSRLRRLADE